MTFESADSSNRPVPPMQDVTNENIKIATQTSKVDKLHLEAQMLIAFLKAEASKQK